MANTELFLIAMLIIFSVPFVLWRYLRTDNFAPMLIVQLLSGIALGPGILGTHFPNSYHALFGTAVVQSLSGISCWAAMLFVFIAGVELDLTQVWHNRRETGITAGFALGVPLALGCLAAMVLLQYPGWVPKETAHWQFMLGVGMACAATALPILILLLEKLELLRHSLGQRSMRYASLDDILIWIVLAIVLMDWQRVGLQLLFFVVFGVAAFAFRKSMSAACESDRWYFALIWLVGCSLAADWCGLHFMEGAFLAGAVIDARLLDQKKMDFLRHNVLMVMMPVFFLSSGLKANFNLGGATVLVVASVLLIASIAGKLIGVQIAGRILRWNDKETSIIGWLLQTKGLTMIVFANVLLDKKIITNDLFTALLLVAIASTMLTVPLVSPLMSKHDKLIAELS